MERTPEVKNHLNANMNIRKKDIMIGNFLGGISWGVGSVIGATITIAIVGGIFHYLGIFQAIGNSIFNSLPPLPQIN